MTTALATAHVAVKPFIRDAVVGDVPALQAMFRQFVQSTNYRKYVGDDPAYSTSLIARLIALPQSAVFVVDAPEGIVGMLGLAIFQHPFSGEAVATEAFWWLNESRKGYGVYLLRRGERWAKTHGALRLSVMAPADKPRVAEIYERLGYDRVEVTYQKDLR